MTAKVVLRLVADKAAPITRDSTVPVPYPRYRSRYDSPMGKRMLVMPSLIEISANAAETSILPCQGDRSRLDDGC
jgi:hypothetical protein